MNFQGSKLSCQEIGQGVVELKLDAQGQSINKLDKVTFAELWQVIQEVQADNSIKGLLLTSGKDGFLVGADINSFLGLFKAPSHEFEEYMWYIHKIFNALEDLNIPTATAINGVCLGGGLELALATDYRVLTAEAKLGFPEVKLGIFPGWGGSVRLPRLIGLDNALEWIASGVQNGADTAFKIGVAEAVVSSDKLKESALKMLRLAISGAFDWQARKEEKKSPLPLSEVESSLAFETAKAIVGMKAGPHYPAPLTAVKSIQKSAKLTRDEALKVECKDFMKLAVSVVAANLVGIFLADQYLKREAKKSQKIARKVRKAAVIGAGIMGGGISYQSASRGIPVVLKDIQTTALKMGVDEVSKLLHKQLSRGKIETMKLVEILRSIHPTLSYESLHEVDIVVEAVVENMQAKTLVINELEKIVSEDTVIASNTSTISITKLAAGMEYPQRFVGMHFFNPVHRMPLVEVIRGAESSDEAIATTVAYAQRMGKKPVVVNDCPGFLINRILFPYFAGFNYLINEGGNFAEIDRVMEKFGWPMGPAYLYDVIGMDTCYHAAKVMAEGFPDRLKTDKQNILDVMYKAKTWGQKTCSGFYRYELDRKGKPRKILDPAVYKKIQTVGGELKEFAAEKIINFMMLPLLFESSRCLEDKIVLTPQELDMGLIYGLGFPPFRGGILKYADTVGLEKICNEAESFSHLGKLYQPTEQIKAMAQSGEKFYNF